MKPIKRLIIKHFWRILNNTTIILLALFLLSFFGVIPFNEQFTPILYSSIFVIFYLIIHYYLSRNIWDGIVFFIIAFLVSASFDGLLIRYGLYQYHRDLVTFWGVPIAAILTWIAAIFQAYHFNNGIFYALRFSKPTFEKKEFSKLLILLFLDGLHLTGIGFMAEYWFVKYQLGTWFIASNSEIFGMPIFQVLMSYFMVGWVGSGTYRVVEFFRNQSQIPTFEGYRYLFGTVYLACFLMGIGVLIDVDFSPIFVAVSIMMLLGIIINDMLHRKRRNRL